MSKHDRERKRQGHQHKPAPTVGPPHVWALYPLSGLHGFPGDYHLTRLEGWLVPVTAVQDGPVFVLDARAIVFCRDPFRLLYDPRENLGHMQSGFAEWMRENPDWPGRGLES